MGLLKIVGAIILIIAIVAAVCYFLGINPFAMAQDGISASVNWFNGLTDMAKVAYASIATSIGGALGWLKTKLNFNGFKQQTASANREVNQKMDALQQISAQKDELLLTERARAEQAEVKLQEIEVEYRNSGTVIDGLKGENERLRAQIEALQKQNVDTFTENVAEKITKKKEENERIS